MGQGWVAGSGRRLRTRTGLKLTAVRPIGQRHAALVADLLRGALHAVRQRDVHGAGGAVYDRLAHLRPLVVGAGEEPDVLGGEIGIEAGDEDGRADDLGVAGGVMLQRAAGRRDVGRVELERLRPGDQHVARRGLRGRARGSQRKRGVTRSVIEVPIWQRHGMLIRHQEGSYLAPVTWRSSAVAIPGLPCPSASTRTLFPVSRRLQHRLEHRHAVLLVAAGTASGRFSLDRVREILQLGALGADARETSSPPACGGPAGSAD